MRVELMLGDCLERMKEIPDQSVDMVMCDLPYGTTACAWDSVIPFAPLWEQYWRICKGAVVLTASQPFTSALVASCIKHFKYEVIWFKHQATNMFFAKYGILKVHENVCVFAKQKTTYNPQWEYGKGYSGFASRIGRKIGEVYSASKSQHRHNPEGQLYPVSALYFAGDKKTVHPTQKPVALMDYMIRTYTNPGDVVLDNCMGSGTTGVAAIEACRSFIGIERDEGYFAIAEKRIRSCETYKLLWGED